MISVPYLTGDIAPVDATFRRDLEDFVVDEVPAYAPSGEGDHTFCRIEKRDLTTREAIRRLCDAVGAKEEAAGAAGLKDRRAVTRQWISLFGVDPRQLEALAIDGVSVLEVERHPTKLRTGHLRGNRFRVRLREIDAAGIRRARAVLEEIERVGLPNYYGEQRFGRRGDNAERAVRWVRGEARPPRQGFTRRLELSALQSALFNRYVAARVTRGCLGTVAAGDVAKRHDTGGLFVVGSAADEVADAQARADRLEISATGPIFGAKMRWPEGRPREEEETLLRSSKVALEHLAQWKRLAPGTRRPVRVPVAPISASVSDDTLLLDFTLPAGSYATILIGEILKRDASGPDPG